MLTAPSLVCQRCSSKALIWTGFCLSAMSAMMLGKRVTRYGSTQRAFCSLLHLARSVVAPIAASLVSLTSAAFWMAVTTALAEVLSV